MHCKYTAQLNLYNRNVLKLNVFLSSIWTDILDTGIVGFLQSSVTATPL